VVLVEGGELCPSNERESRVLDQLNGPDQPDQRPRHGHVEQEEIDGIQDFTPGAFATQAQVDAINGDVRPSSSSTGQQPESERRAWTDSAARLPDSIAP
jgi:hypothetical protein